MADRFIHLRNGGTSFVLDVQPPDADLPVIRHFGADLGENADLEALFAAKPIERWGARLDATRVVSVLPRAGDGSFAAPGMGDDCNFLPIHLEAETKTGGKRVTLALRSGAHQFAGELMFKLGRHGVLQLSLLSAELDDGGCVNRTQRVHAFTLPLPRSLQLLRHITGDWAREFEVIEVPASSFQRETRRGRPGHDSFPALIACAPDANESHGECIALVLGWSGDHVLRCECRRDGTRMLQIGKSPLQAGREPSLTAYAAYSAGGFNLLSQCLHATVRSGVLPPLSRSKERPVHFNSWEAIYFKHDEGTLRDLASRAASLGVERFVLDDGWFLNRNSDSSGLGDWSPDPAKYPNGLQPIVDYVRQRGMEFGLWVEPEMVNPDSDLYRAHPDWVLRHPGRQPFFQRNQLVLDLTKEDVTEHLFAVLDRLLCNHPVAYLKWDMNRDLTEEDHKTGPYVEALYRLLGRIRLKHKTVEIETCASGGGRCDYRMLSYADRVWVSDNNDALDRLRINRGASLFLPLRVMGTHVGPEICHTTGRRLSLDLRAHVALFGHFGLELDIRQLTDKEIARLKAHIDNYKRFRALIHDGRYWRIESHEPDHLIDAVTSEEKGEALLRVVRVDSKRLGQGTTAFIPGLGLDKIYRLAAVPPFSSSVESSLSPALRDGTLKLTGRMLAAAGLSLYLPRPETSLLVHLKA